MSIEDSYYNGENESVRAPAFILKHRAPDGKPFRTQRRWRAAKRTELKKLAKAVDTYRMGCAHCPGCAQEFAAIEKNLTALLRRHSVKNWSGRKSAKDVEQLYGT